MGVMLSESLFAPLEAAMPDTTESAVAAAVRQHMAHGAMAGSDPLTDVATEAALTAGMTCADIDARDSDDWTAVGEAFGRSIGWLAVALAVVAAVSLAMLSGVLS